MQFWKGENNMKTYLIQIGNMNGQYNYKVKANSDKSAKQLAISRHKELGRSLENKRVYIAMCY